eukprot:Polyplicarium_translucidae@DN2832_c2_g3_i1.p1
MTQRRYGMIAAYETEHEIVATRTGRAAPRQDAWLDDCAMVLDESEAPGAQSHLLQRKGRTAIFDPCGIAKEQVASHPVARASPAMGHECQTSPNDTPLHPRFVNDPDSHSVFGQKLLQTKRVLFGAAGASGSSAGCNTSWQRCDLR